MAILLDHLRVIFVIFTVLIFPYFLKLYLLLEQSFALHIAALSDSPLLKASKLGPTLEISNNFQGVKRLFFQGTPVAFTINNCLVMTNL